MRLSTLRGFWESRIRLQIKRSHVVGRTYTKTHTLCVFSACIRYLQKPQKLLSLTGLPTCYSSIEMQYLMRCIRDGSLELQSR